MDSGIGNSSVEDVVSAAAVSQESPASTVELATNQQQHHRGGSCQAEGGDCAKCGESKLLDANLVEQLNLLYVDRLRYIEKNGNDDHVKIEVYEDWIKQLRMLNLNLVEAIQAMQEDCRNRLKKMDDGHKKNLTRFGPEVFYRLESDRNSLLEVIRRAYATGEWDISGLKFFDITSEQLFGPKNDNSGVTQTTNNVDGPTTISVNLAVSSNCQIENTQLDELQQKLDAKERQIKHLETLLAQKFPGEAFLHEDGSTVETDSDFRDDECETSNKLLLQRLRQLNNEKNEEMNQRSILIEEKNREINTLKQRLEEIEASSQNLDSIRSLAEFKLDDTDASNKKLLQQLHNLSRIKCEQLEAKKRENEVLLKQISTLRAQLESQSNADNQSLVNEIKDHHTKNCQLEKKLRDYDQWMREANSAVQHKNKVIEKLRKDIKELKKCFPAATELPGDIECMSNPSIETLSLISSESIMSFGSASSGSSTETVAARPIATEREQVEFLKEKLAAMDEQLRLFQATRQAQDDICAKQCARLDAYESEQKILRNEYENNEKRLFLVRAEIIRLIKDMRECLKDQVKLPQTIKPIEELIAQPLIGTNVDIYEKDKVILGSLKQHMDAIAYSYLKMLAEQKQTNTQWREKLNILQQDNKKYEELIETLQNERLVAESVTETEEKETSIDSDIMTMSSSEVSETLAAQRIRMQSVLHDMAKEIAYLIGKDLSNDSLSSFSELDATPLHFLIGDLKKEIEAKDELLQGKSDCIETLEQQIFAKEKELHRLQLRQDTMEVERLNYEKRIENLKQALKDHDETIDVYKQENGTLKQQLEDIHETLQAYKDNIRRVIEEKSHVEDECKNQLVTISNLRTALEETKRNGSASVNNLREIIQTLQSEGTLLSEQLNHAFRENLVRDDELEHYRDSNLQLRCQISELTRNLSELKDVVALVDVRRELEEQKQRHLAQIKNELKCLQAQMTEFQGEIASRQRDRDYLIHFREKCAELEMEHQQELQRMRNEIESLSAQLTGCSETSIQHEQLLRESNDLQNTLLELGNHNEVLQKAIQSYEEKVELLQQELSTFNFQYDNLNQELANLKSSCSEKDNKIISLNVEREKLLGDLNLHKRMCKCGFNNSLKERSKTPVSHSLQRQVVQKTLEATKAADALKQRTVEFKKLENQYVEERIRLTEQTTELFTQIGKLKGKNSNLEQSLYHKEELIDRLQQNLRDVSQRLTTKSDIAQTMEAKNTNLSQVFEKFREDSTVREKKLAEELNNIRRNSQDQQNQLQQCENQLAWHRDELESLRGKVEHLLKERDTLKQETVDLSSKLACSAGKESALCEVLKQLQDELSVKTGRLAEVEENYRRVSHAYQSLKSFNEDLSKQYQVARSHLENYKILVEFKRQTINTVELARKCAEESRQRERTYEQKLAEQKRVIGVLKDDRVKLMEKLNDYHRDSLILNRTLEEYQQAYGDSRRNVSTSFHQTVYPSEAYKLVRSSSDPNCKESDDLHRRLQYTKDRIHRTREFWHRGIKEILSPK